MAEKRRELINARSARSGSGRFPLVLFSRLHLGLLFNLLLNPLPENDRSLVAINAISKLNDGDETIRLTVLYERGINERPRVIRMITVIKIIRRYVLD